MLLGRDTCKIQLTVLIVKDKTVTIDEKEVRADVRKLAVTSNSSCMFDCYISSIRDIHHIRYVGTRKISIPL